MSLLDSMKYGRRSMSSFTREEIMQIRNTPRPDLDALRAESERIMQRILAERERENAAAAHEIPNKATLASLRETRSGKGLKEYASVQDMADDLGL